MLSFLTSTWATNITYRMLWSFNNQHRHELL